MTKQTAVIGYPIEHSVSPQIHNYWISKHKLNINQYKKISVAPENLNTFLLQCKEEQYCGINITIPHKQNTFDLCDRVSKTSAKLRAVNTVIFKNGMIIGDNTDAIGFQNSIPERIIHSNIKNQKTIVIGAGGAARSIIMILEALGSDVIVANRTIKNAEHMKNDLSLNFQICSLSEIPNYISSCKCIINTTNLGMEQLENNLINFNNVEVGTYVYDLIYNPKKTKFLKDAENKGMIIQNGLRMLMHQAAASFKIWHDIYPIVDDELIKFIMVK